MVVRETDPRSQLSLPPGFRFYPTDEELLVQYLCKKIAGHHFTLEIIGDVDLYKFDPWDLPSKAMFGEKEWYFFSPRDRKYPNGSRPNRVAGSGYWKATGTDKIITTEGTKVGVKKALVFYVGKAPKGTKTNWIMHEYRLFEPPMNNRSAKLDDWVLCRIYKKNSSTNPRMEIQGAQSRRAYSNGSFSSSSSQNDDALVPKSDGHRFVSLQRMNDQELNNVQQLGLTGGSGDVDWAMLQGINSVPEPVQAQYDPEALTTRNGIVCVPGVVRDEETQSGLRNNRVGNSVVCPQKGTESIPGFSNSFGPFAVRFPPQAGGLGFGV